MNQSIELGLEDSYSEEEEELLNENDDNQPEVNAEVVVNEETENQNENQDGPGTTKTKSARKKVVRNPQPKLDATRLSGERGIPVLPGIFCKFEWKGKGHELADLQKFLRYLEHWAHRLYPKLPFDDVLERIEQLGKKKEMRTLLTKIRLDIPLLNSDIVSNDKDDDDELTFTQPSELGITDNNSDRVWDELIKDHENISESDLDRAPLSPTFNTVKVPLSEEQLKRIKENQRRAQQFRAAKIHERSNSLEIGNLSNFQCIKTNSISQELGDDEVENVSETSIKRPRTDDIVYTGKLVSQDTVLVVDDTGKIDSQDTILNKPVLNTGKLEPQDIVLVADDKTEHTLNTGKLESQDTIFSRLVIVDKPVLNTEELEPQDTVLIIDDKLEITVNRSTKEFEQQNGNIETDIDDKLTKNKELNSISEATQNCQNDIEMSSLVSGPESMEIDL